MNGVPSLLNVDDAYFFRERFPEANAPGMVGIILDAVTFEF
jgi:hypothetical protein